MNESALEGEESGEELSEIGSGKRETKKATVERRREAYLRER